MRSPQPTPQPSPAFWLISASGLVPFVVCLTLAYGVPSLHDAAVRTFLVYSALTLAFLGGARWGAELARAPHGPQLGRLMLAATPTVVGLAALLPQTPVRLGVGLLLCSGVAQLAWDVRASREGLLPAWNATVRTVMTGLGTLCTAALWPAV